MNRPGPTREKTIALFLLGLILFNPPFLNIFNADAQATLFQIPALYIYFFSAWIFLIILVARSAKAAEPPKAPGQEGTRQDQLPRDAT